MSENPVIDTEATRVEEPPKPEDKAIAPKKETPPPIPVEQDGMLVGKTFEDQQRLAATWCASGMVPKSFDKPAKVLAGMQFAVGLGLAPTISSLRNIAVINGQPSIWGELPLELVRKSGELEEFEEYLIGHDQERLKYVTDWDDIFAAVCVVKRKGKPRKEFTFTKFQADQGIQGIAKIWQGYYDVMMKRKCRARALKDEFTDILGSRSIAEYDFNFTPEEPKMEQKLKDVTNSVANDVDLL